MLKIPPTAGSVAAAARVAATMSLTNVKSRVWSPSPKTSIGSSVERGAAEAAERHVRPLPRPVDREVAAARRRARRGCVVERAQVLAGQLRHAVGREGPRERRPRRSGSARPGRRPTTRTRRRTRVGRAGAPPRAGAGSPARCCACRSRSVSPARRGHRARPPGGRRCRIATRSESSPRARSIGTKSKPSHCARAPGCAASARGRSCR